MKRIIFIVLSLFAFLSCLSDERILNNMINTISKSEIEAIYLLDPWDDSDDNNYINGFNFIDCKTNIDSVIENNIMNELINKDNYSSEECNIVSYKAFLPDVLIKLKNGICIYIILEEKDNFVCVHKLESVSFIFKVNKELINNLYKLFPKDEYLTQLYNETN